MNRHKHSLSGEDSDHSLTEETGGRGCRKRKKYTEPIHCPVCGITIRANEIDTHFNLEVEKLNCIKHKSNGRSAPSTSSGSYAVAGPSTSSAAASTENSARKTYKRVRMNRRTRERERKRLSCVRRYESPDGRQLPCPVCFRDSFDEDLKIHVDECLRKLDNGEDPNAINNDTTDSDGGTESNTSIDVENFVEYDWAGETRTRASSLLQNDLSALMSGNKSLLSHALGAPSTTTSTSTSVDINNDNDDGENLNVDDDAYHEYGPVQYTERDIIPSDRTNSELRNAITGGVPAQSTSRIYVINSSSDDTPPDTDRGDDDDDSSSVYKSLTAKSPGGGGDGSGGVLIEALKSRIKELENRATGEVYKCLICLDRYKTPVISVCCWHVHCEQCWLQTLGTKKLCPQCNMITQPTELRKIYM